MLATTERFMLIWADRTAPYMYTQSFVHADDLLKYLPHYSVTEEDIKRVLHWIQYVALPGSHIKVDAQYGETELENSVCNLIIIRK